MKVLFLTNVPSPYRVDFFNELGKACELTVGFEKNTSDERDSSWKNYKFEHFEGVILKGKSISTDAAICPGVVALIKRCKYDEIIVCNISSPTGILAIEYMKLRNIPYWIEGDGGFAKSGKGVKERIKKHLLTGAKGYFSTSKAHDEYYISYGADPNIIHRYPFTSMSETDLMNANTLHQQDRNRLREKLKMEEKFIILTVGRFSYQNGYGKGYDVLMRIAEKIGNHYGIYMVGDEPTEEFMRWKEEKHLNHVHFIGFKKKEQLAEYYAAADVFVLLSRGEAWGLAINEAMMFSLPVITTEHCVAGSELVKDNVNGFIVSLDNEEVIAKSVMECAEFTVQQRFGRESRNIIQSYTIEKMAEVHRKILGG